MTVCIDAFRQAVRQIPTPVAVVTTRDRDGVSHGMTVGSIGFVSLDPPMMQFSVAQRSSAHAAFTAADRVAVSILGADQASVADQLAGRADERFRGCWELKAGLLVVPSAVSHLLCSVECRVPAGDHTLMLLRVTELSEPATPRSPLVRWNQTYASIDAPDDVDGRLDIHVASPVR
jgi:flavin reductase (DIM6/NTAB) family NADH-FMN oxidoreductase RutF